MSEIPGPYSLAVDRGMLAIGFLQARDTPMDILLMVADYWDSATNVYIAMLFPKLRVTLYADCPKQYFLWLARIADHVIESRARREMTFAYALQIKLQLRLRVCRRRGFVQ